MIAHLQVAAGFEGTRSMKECCSSRALRLGAYGGEGSVVFLEQVSALSAASQHLKVSLRSQVTWWGVTQGRGEAQQGGGAPRGSEHPCARVSRQA